MQMQNSAQQTCACCAGAEADENGSCAPCRAAESAHGQTPPPAPCLDELHRDLAKVTAERVSLQKLSAVREAEGYDKQVLRDRVKRMQLHEQLLVRKIELLTPAKLPEPTEDDLREQVAQIKAHLSERRGRMRHSSGRWREEWAQQVTTLETELAKAQKQLDALRDRDPSIAQWPRPKQSGHDHPWYHEPSPRELRRIRAHARCEQQLERASDLRRSLADVLSRIGHVHHYRQLRSYDKTTRTGELVEMSEQGCACGAERQVVRRYVWHGRVTVEIRRVMSGTWDIEGRIAGQIESPAPVTTSSHLTTQSLQRLLR
jgi:hypothetical protein